MYQKMCTDYCVVPKYITVVSVWCDEIDSKYFQSARTQINRIITNHDSANEKYQYSTMLHFSTASIWHTKFALYTHLCGTVIRAQLTMIYSCARNFVTSMYITASMYIYCMSYTAHNYTIQNHFAPAVSSQSHSLRKWKICFFIKLCK